MKNEKKIDFLFEVSWEVCNKVGGIHTVVETKALTLEKVFKDNFILIGPDLDREGRSNPEFEEDLDTFKSWRTILLNQGIRVKIGRWKIIGKPLVFLIDFSSLFSRKDEVFTELWTDYKVDSLSGSWDYIEAAMFGHAAGIVIESFHNFHLSVRQNVIAHFHEWMTGAGLLYLKSNAPQISTVFTTHATTLGRSIAGNNFPLYSIMPKINGDSKAKELNVVAKHSLEKSAAREADSFTTVSHLTAAETKQFLEKEVDVVTPNGFEANMVPADEEYAEIKTGSHSKLREVSEALFGYELDEDTAFVSTSGRYEYKNKGLDVFIDVFAELNQKEEFHKKIVAFILVPANNYGPRKDLMEKLNGNSTQDLDNKFLTHYLHDADFDTILRRIKELGFTNGKEQNAKIIFVPAYLNGDDGIFNRTYYDLLPAFNMTIYPSYYEPWGYTPLESLAFHVPTITTSLAGFGIWIQNSNTELGDCLTVVNRTDDNYRAVVKDILGTIITCSYKTQKEIEYERNNALFLSKTALWKNLITYYYEAYDIAIKKQRKRTEGIVIKQVKEPLVSMPKFPVNKPKWRTASVLPNLPEKLKGLDELSKNLWWEWNFDAIELFKSIDEELWSNSKNPIKLLKEVEYETLVRLERDRDFISKYEEVYRKFTDYVNTEYRKDLPTVTYFSMEYGLANPLKIYSGGLGILAGDYLKQASDKGIELVAVGLMYKFGYFTQQLSIRGEQIVSYDLQNFADLPVELVRDKKNEPIIVNVGLPGRIVHLQIWKVNVGRIPLYLLDSDVDKNNHDDRTITHKLYGGDNEHRLKQEFILGIGGARAIRKMNISSNVYHSNEGHSAFIGIERINQYMNEHRLTFAEAVEIVRGSTLFTTHTPVPAGHDVFPEDLLMGYFGHYPERLKISWTEFLKLGKLNPGDKTEKFSMSHLAANLSQEINGVSYLHGEVTKDMFYHLWEGYYPEELHIGYVTNGVHYQTWAASEWKKLIDKYFSEKSDKLEHDMKVWSKIYEVPDKEIWDIRDSLRKELVSFIKNRISSHYVRQRKSPQQIVAIQNKVNDKILTLGFARRFATYKRAYLLFYDTEKLANILNNPKQPVQIIFAGKAHPADGQGQELIQRINEISKLPAFLGKIIFLENYDMEVAKKMVQGVDVWINTPTRPLEASGTSGMKATMNGVLNLSVLDGWWVEGYKEGAGWALPLDRTYENQEFQNQLDAEMIYEMLENEIVPMFYKRDDSGIPREWIQFIKKNLAQIAPEFTTARMLDDYIDRFYKKLSTRKDLLRKNDFFIAHEISAWKKRMAYSWESIVPLKVVAPKEDSPMLSVGEKYYGEVVIDLNEISPENVGVELLIVEEDDGNVKILQKQEMNLVTYENNIATYALEVKPARPGIYKYSFRAYPKNELLPHRQDFPLVLWI
ncbi:MAG: alpha-glucan family phosphorylase [Bacteroidales bacterium]|nr:alpha-glucan family phosphorylase [Bacteroidales bacterium]